VPWLMRMMVRRQGVMAESGLVFCERLHSSLNKAILTSGNAEVLDQCGASEFSTKDWAYGC
jgi:hypothetical protein